MSQRQLIQVGEVLSLQPGVPMEAFVFGISMVTEVSRPAQVPMFYLPAIGQRNVSHIVQVPNSSKSGVRYSDLVSVVKEGHSGNRASSTESDQTSA